MSPADHHCAKRIASLWEQANRSLAKIANYLHAARGQLPAEDFGAIVGELPFPRECVDHFLTIGNGQNPLAFSTVVVTGLDAVAQTVGTPTQKVEVPAERRSPRQLRLSLSADEFDLATSLSPEEVRAAFNSGVRTVLDTKAAKAKEAVPPSAAEMLQAAE